MSVGVTEESHLQLLARLTDENDEIVMAGMEFEHTGKEEFLNQVRDEALNKAMEQRKTYEERLGIKLIPINFSERRPVPNSTRLETGEARFAQSRADASVAPAAVMPPAQTFDEVTYEATVYVTFKVVADED
jgi:uncharacterized protein YggE